MGWCAKPFPGILRSFLCASPFVSYVARSVFSFGRSLVATAKIVHHHAPRQLLGPKLSISEALFTHHAVPFSYSFLTFRSSPLSDLRRGAGCLQRRANHQHTQRSRRTSRRKRKRKTLTCTAIAELALHTLHAILPCLDSFFSFGWSRPILLYPIIH